MLNIPATIIYILKSIYEYTTNYGQQLLLRVVYLVQTWTFYIQNSLALVTSQIKGDKPYTFAVSMNGVCFTYRSAMNMAPFPSPPGHLFLNDQY